MIVRTADGGAACVVSPAEAVCSNRRSQGRGSLALVLPANRGPALARRPLRWMAATSILGRSPLALGAFVCSAVGRTILCHNGAGGAIAVRSGRLSTPVASAQAHSH